MGSSSPLQCSVASFSTARGWLSKNCELTPQGTAAVKIFFIPVEDFWNSSVLNCMRPHLAAEDERHEDRASDAKKSLKLPAAFPLARRCSMSRSRHSRKNSPNPRKVLADYRRAFPTQEAEIVDEEEVGRRSPSWRKARRRSTGTGALSHGMRARIRLRRNLERIRSSRRGRLRSRRT